LLKEEGLAVHSIQPLVGRPRAQHSNQEVHQRYHSTELVQARWVSKREWVSP
jgi:hypothetical protein